MIAIIPARGGSKGLPGKNIKLLNGIPLIAYTIKAAMAAKNITRVIVSTDDEEIARISKEHHAEVPFMRPEYLASDTALSIDVFEYTINKIQELENINEPIENFVVLQPTSPFRTSEDIDDAIDLFFTKKAFSVISFCKEFHPISWHKYLGEDGTINSIKEEELQNRQEILPTYFPNGALYVLSREVFRTRNYYAKNSYAFVMNRIRSIDIDTIEDFEYAEFVLYKNSSVL